MAEDWPHDRLNPTVAEAWSAFAARYRELEDADPEEGDRCQVAEEHLSVAQERRINAFAQTPADFAAKLRAIFGDLSEARDAAMAAVSGHGIPRIVLSDYRYRFLWKVIEQAEQMAAPPSGSPLHGRRGRAAARPRHL